MRQRIIAHGRAPSLWPGFVLRNTFTYVQGPEHLDCELDVPCARTLCFFQGLVVPREVIWLNGAPGSGKGANLGFIRRIRGLSRAVTVSTMLENHPDAQAVVRAGGLVSDELVGDALLAEACDRARGAEHAGLIIDGFPRTEAQARRCLPPRCCTSCCMAQSSWAGHP